MASYLLLKTIRKAPGQVIKLIKKPAPRVTEGFGKRAEAAGICEKAGYKSVLLVTDKTLYSLGYHTAVTEALSERGIKCGVFCDISSEPNVSIIENGDAAAKECGAECIIALGGGSVLDSCKMIAVAEKLKRGKIKKLLRKFVFVLGGTLPMISIPSTAGTGAEFTVGAVVTDRKGKKTSTVIAGLNVTDVILDSELTVKTPQKVTAGCGIDALSHGLEGIVASVRSGEENERKSMECVKLVLENLPRVLETPGDVEARQNMCRAAFYGGNAINEQLAGYVHAFAHSLGAMYHIPHGAAIAAALMPVMEFQEHKCEHKLALTARCCGLADENAPDPAAARALLDSIGALIKKCGFARTEIKPEDRRELIKRITDDSINYSAPVVMKKREINELLDKINER